MSRWHAEWCTSPTVQVGDDQVPRCMNCQTTAHARLKTADRPNPVPRIPKDEEYGSLNLSWPPTVTFTSGENATHPPADKGKDDQEAELASPQSSDSVVIDHDATTTLSSDEFRLAVLHAVGDRGKSYPIHVDLELHKDTQFPDYDAVLYTWVDENGNSERCHPIYVGDYWDITFQTKNCCDMLRYLRPSRGLKLVWVDAICIDQNNLKERAMQVAKMGQIYSRCSQGWAWMGNDLVRDDLQGLPERRWLHELGTTSGHTVSSSENNMSAEPRRMSADMDILKLLKRKYFGRVWIIQELVLAPRVLIPIGNVISAADHITARKLTTSEKESANTREFSWNDTEAPWLKYMAQGRIDGSGLWEIMALTAKSDASDFRDKLYGILGLLSFGSNSNPLQPNYAISARHMVIGFFAHCLVNDRNPQLFFAAQGHAAHEGVSWIPAWETQRSWEQVFVEPFELVYDFYQSGASDPEHRIIIQLKYDHFKRIGIQFIKSSGVPWMSVNIRLDVLKMEVRFHDERNLRQNFCQIYPWHRDITVDSNTGSISLWLTRLASVGSAPVEALEEFIDDLTLYRINTGPGQSFLIGSQHPLDRLLKHDDELFALDREVKLGSSNSDRLVFMVLRKQGDGRHRLLTCFSYLCFCPMPWLTTYEEPRFLNELQESVQVARRKIDRYTVQVGQTGVR
ncbi:heterokaryon incompatibility protein-domain-containing protein [Colletotrichum phormii]|uniref:Heterokaryon incompatibility protein-domain-containing protein n=1 Tax=Colletotrichum phormii TaxID=359342 RepID=A0AAI9ZBT7_9PEZI|nr:heterokaryon incompatibility protein-domain-containing protein [Colletotrichum phormii]KAK1621634.1 heterokaryon incompatibility protein-domain-containing protein [Colletotrichum phormii]